MREGTTAVTERLPDPDRTFMRRALALAEEGAGLASPNPMVGAVVVSPAGLVVGEGWHEGPGSLHAELVAVAAAGPRARGSTLYVTLEPCSHHGRTPPCAPAIVRAGIVRVVAGATDPNPVVHGRGFEVLRRAGIDLRVGVVGRAARRLIEGFARHVTAGVPFVTLKMAASLDGRVAARDGSSRWITGEAAREDVHRLRARSDAVLVGSGTVLADDPALSIRLSGYRGRRPLRVVADGRGRTPPTAAVLDGTCQVLVATTSNCPQAARASWEAAGAEVAVLDGPEPDGGVDLPALMVLLGKRDVQTVLVEGGPTLAWSAVRSGVVDRLVLYLAPKVLGGRDAPGVLAGDGVAGISGAIPVALTRVRRLGSDLKVVADVHGDR